MITIFEHLAYVQVSWPNCQAPRVSWSCSVSYPPKVLAFSQELVHCKVKIWQFPWRNYSAADSAWVRLGPSRSAADAGGVRQIQFRRGTKNSAAESAADSADCRGTILFRRGSDRIRGGLAELPPAECTEKGPRESATRIFRERPLRTFEKFLLRGTIPRLTTVPRNHSAANNRVAEPFCG